METYNLDDLNCAKHLQNYLIVHFSVTYPSVALNNLYLGLVATKPVFGVSDNVRFKAACSATETSQKSEVLLVASLDMVLYKARIAKALIRLRGCADWSAPVLFANPRRQAF